MHRAFPPTHKHTQRGAREGKGRRAQQRRHPTIISGVADQAQLTGARSFETSRFHMDGELVEE